MSYTIPAPTVRQRNVIEYLCNLVEQNSSARINPASVIMFDLQTILDGPVYGAKTNNFFPNFKRYEASLTYVKIGHTKTPGDHTIKLELSSEEYETATNMLKGDGDMFPVQRIFVPVSADVTFKCIPGMLGRIRGPIDPKWYALSCTCRNTYFCDHIVKNNEFQVNFMRKLTSCLIKEFTLMACLPLFGRILYPVLFEKKSIEDWEGNPSLKLLVSTSDMETFLDFAEATSHSGDELVDRILRELEQSVDSPEMLPFRKKIEDFRDVNANFHCMQYGSSTGAAGGHNYGTTAKFRSWLSSSDEKTLGSREQRTKAATFCLATYGLCYICYQHNMPAFSLVEL